MSGEPGGVVRRADSPNDATQGPLSIDNTLPRPRESGVVGRLVWEEVVRAGLAFTFVVILAATIVFAFANVNSANWANTKDLLQLLLPAETALLGSAVGFYFGTRKS